MGRRAQVAVSLAKPPNQPQTKQSVGWPAIHQLVQQLHWEALLGALTSLCSPAKLAGAGTARRRRRQCALNGFHLSHLWHSIEALRCCDC